MIHVAEYCYNISEAYSTDIELRLINYSRCPNDQDKISTEVWCAYRVFLFSLLVFENKFMHQLKKKLLSSNFKHNLRKDKTKIQYIQDDHDDNNKIELNKSVSKYFSKAKNSKCTFGMIFVETLQIEYFSFSAIVVKPYRDICYLYPYLLK